jgi:hypothetical protein
MKLLAVDSNKKHACLSKLSKSKQKIMSMLQSAYFNTYKDFCGVIAQLNFIDTAGYPTTSGFNLWTSGIQDKRKVVSWCSKKFAAENGPINWSAGQMPSTGCIALALSNSTVNESTFAVGDCKVAQYFVCEVCAQHMCI